jgi:hypothetical protein
MTKFLGYPISPALGRSCCGGSSTSQPPHMRKWRKIRAACARGISWENSTVESYQFPTVYWLSDDIRTVWPCSLMTILADEWSLVTQIFPEANLRMGTPPNWWHETSKVSLFPRKPKDWLRSQTWCDVSRLGLKSKVEALQDLDGEHRETESSRLLRLHSVYWVYCMASNFMLFCRVWSCLTPKTISNQADLLCGWTPAWDSSWRCENTSKAGMVSWLKFWRV